MFKITASKHEVLPGSIEEHPIAIATVPSIPLDRDTEFNLQAMSASLQGRMKTMEDSMRQVWKEHLALKKVVEENMLQGNRFPVNSQYGHMSTGETVRRELDQLQRSLASIRTDLNIVIKKLSEG